MNAVTGMTGERTNYLSVALRARGAIKTLKKLMSERQGILSLSNTELQTDLKGVLQSLKAIESSEPFSSNLSNESSYRPFEEVQTLDEVSKRFKGVELLTSLESLISGGCGSDEMRTAIRLFSAIEKTALYHYSDPSGAGA